jgi:hypothetical protein
VPSVASISAVAGITAVAASTAVAGVTVFDDVPAVDYIVYKIKANRSSIEILSIFQGLCLWTNHIQIKGCKLYMYSDAYKSRIQKAERPVRLFG